MDQDLDPKRSSPSRITEDTSEAEVLAWLHECSRYPPSAQRTASTDTLLDLLLEWAGV